MCTKCLYNKISSLLANDGVEARKDPIWQPQSSVGSGFDPECSFHFGKCAQNTPVTPNEGGISNTNETYEVSSKSLLGQLGGWHVPFRKRRFRPINGTRD